MINTSYCTGRVTAGPYDSVGLFCGYCNDLDTLENSPIPFVTEGINNYALSYYNNANSSVRKKVGKFRYNIAFVWRTSTSNSNTYQQVIEWGDASAINRSTNYTAYAYDSYLMGGNASVSYPYRCFVGGTHYGDWPLLQGGTNLTTSNTSISIPNPNLVFTGSEIQLAEEELTVVYNNRTTLERDSDYLITYSNNTDCGVATVTITGVNGFVGSVSATFNIVQADINYTDIVFTDSSTNNLDGVNYVFTGEEIKPEIGSISYNGIELTPNDYTVDYLNNAT
jgi:hypothetical protein